MTLRTTPQVGNGYTVKYTTDTDVMSSTANYIEQVGYDMTSAVDNLMAQLASLPDAWQGPAATAYYGDGHTEGAVAHWHRKHRELIDACMAIVQALRSSGKGYDTTESDNWTTVRHVTPL